MYIYIYYIHQLYMPLYENVKLQSIQQKVFYLKSVIFRFVF